MAEPISVTSAIVGLVAVGCQASKALRNTIQSYKDHPKHVRDLRDELHALEDVLQLLEKTVRNAENADFATLESPLRRCGCACKEFEQALQKCSGRNEGERSSFRDWLKIRWMGNDINGFKDTLAGYKATITIAIVGVNLQTTKASLDVIHEYKEMIQTTTIDLNEHLRSINTTLRDIHTQEQGLQEDPVSESAMQAERDSTIRCLEICEQVASFIDERQILVDKHISNPTASPDQAEPSTKQASPRQIMDGTLQDCKTKINLANSQLLHRLENLSTTLKYKSSNSPQAAPSRSEEREQLAEEISGIRQCLEICVKAAEVADQARVNVMEEIETEEDSRQVLVSTIGDLISARRVTAGARSLQCIGQMSDETLQQMSRTHSSPSADINRSATASSTVSDPRHRLGRTLGSGNVKTL